MHTFRIKVVSFIGLLLFVLLAISTLQKTPVQAVSLNASDTALAHELQRLTADTLKINNNLSNASDDQKEAVRGQLRQALENRKTRLISALADNPGAVAASMLPNDTRKELPPDLQNTVEQEVTMNGTIMSANADDFVNKKSKFFYTLKTNTGDYDLHVGDKEPSDGPIALSGTRIEVKGYKLDKHIVMPDSSQNGLKKLAAAKKTNSVMGVSTVKK
jgi:hypothetical protein